MSLFKYFTMSLRLLFRYIVYAVSSRDHLFSKSAAWLKRAIKRSSWDTEKKLNSKQNKEQGVQSVNYTYKKKQTNQANYAKTEQWMRTQIRTAIQRILFGRKNKGWLQPKTRWFLVQWGNRMMHIEPRLNKETKLRFLSQTALVTKKKSKRIFLRGIVMLHP